MPTPAATPIASPHRAAQQAARGADRLSWPVQRKARLTSFFDYRDTGFLAIGDKRIHEGLDMATLLRRPWSRPTAGSCSWQAGASVRPPGSASRWTLFYRRLERLGRMNDLPIAVVIDDGTATTASTSTFGRPRQGRASA